MQIISGLQNFDRSSVASVVTAADKVLTMHLSLNVYCFVLKCIAVLLLYFKKKIILLLQTSLRQNNVKNVVYKSDSL